MKERKKPTQSWVERSKHEIEHEEELLAKRLELLNDIRIKKLLYEDSEAFKIGYEAGFARLVRCSTTLLTMSMRCDMHRKSTQKPFLLDTDATHPLSWKIRLTLGLRKITHT